MPQGELFDPAAYEVPIEERPEYMGEHPPIDLLAVADDLHDRGRLDDAHRLLDGGRANYERLLGRAMLSGEINATQAYDALTGYDLDMDDGTG